VYPIIVLIHTPTSDVGSELEHITSSKTHVRVHVSRGGRYSDSIGTDRLRSPCSLLTWFKKKTPSRVKAGMLTRLRTPYLRIASRGREEANCHVASF